MSNTKRSHVRSRGWSVFSLVLSGVIVIAAAWILFNRHYVADALSVWSYKPPADIVAIEQRSHMTDHGRFLFYATKPSVLGSDEFNQQCPRQEVGSPILGCYTGEDRIYIYNITDENLDGIKEVTAAHEMLHAAWKRTGASDQQRIGDLLKQAYNTIDDERLKTRMDYYERTEPGEFVNELHSILGTEVANVGPELETYYARYFDRATVLALRGDYNNFYVNLTDQANALYEKMTALASSINTQSEAYKGAVAQLSADITSFNNRANNGNFSSQAQFNAERAALVRRSGELEADRKAVNADITTYNTYYSQYQELTGQLQLLNQSMDSYNTLKAAPSV